MIAFLFLFGVSCKKDTDIQNSSQSNHSSLKLGDLIPNPTALDIQNHIVWIAKGLPFLAQNTDFRYSVEESVGLSNFFEATNSNVHNDAWNNYSYHYQDSLLAALDNHVPSNLYDPDHFGGFYYGSCDMFFKIKIPEMDEQDTSLQHIVIPDLVTQADTNDIYKAFFLNSGHLDSLTLTLEDFEDYYIWVVTAEDNCPPLLPVGCNNNGVCQPQLGETPENCEDCIGTNDEANKMGSLILKGFISKRDWKNKSAWPEDKFEESWIKNKYEIALSWAVVSGTALESKSLSAQYAQGKHNDEPYYKKLSAWGNNCDVKRSKQLSGGGTKSNRGVENSFIGINEVLDENFNFEKDSIYFVFYEIDPNFGNTHSTNIVHHSFFFNPKSFREPFSKNVILGTNSHVVDAPSTIAEWVKIVTPPFTSGGALISGWNVVGSMNGRDILECTVETTEFSFVLRLEPTH